MKIKGIVRNKEVIYGKQDLETLFEFKKFQFLWSDPKK